MISPSVIILMFVFAGFGFLAGYLLGSKK